jgi:hypothetical protein
MGHTQRKRVTWSWFLTDERTGGILSSYCGEDYDFVLLGHAAVKTRRYTNVSEKHIVSILRTKDNIVPDETKVAGNRSAQFRVTKAAQQSFRVTLWWLII